MRCTTRISCVRSWAPENLITAGAGAGATFANSFTNWPLCCPSRATFYSGQYAHNHGVLGNSPPQGGFTRFNDANALPVWLMVLVVSLFVYAVSFLAIRLLSRYRELSADRAGAYLTGKPSQLASALTKISGDVASIPTKDLREVQSMNAFFITPAISGMGVKTLTSTHPSLEQRLELGSIRREKWLAVRLGQVCAEEGRGDPRVPEVGPWLEARHVLGTDGAAETRVEQRSECRVVERAEHAGNVAQRRSLVASF